MSKGTITAVSVLFAIPFAFVGAVMVLSVAILPTANMPEIRTLIVGVGAIVLACFVLKLGEVVGS